MRLTYSIVYLFLGLYAPLFAQVQKSDQLKVLFIGNSLTYQNDLPGLVLQEFQQAKESIQVEMIALPNYALIDHWNDQSIQKAIAQGNFDFVIVQQGPSSQAFGKQILIDYGNKINDLCIDNGTKLMFYMVWPAKIYYYTFDQVIENYRDAANINNALICPVGEVWKAAYDRDPKAGLYGPDDFHPSIKGSQLAAKTIYKCLKDNSN